jgi:hypothetical protein
VDDDATRDLVPDLQRWEEAGGTWRPLIVSPTRVVVSLCRCDGGEEVERLASAHPGTVRFVSERQPAPE